MSSADDEVLHFGVFELDLAARQLRKRGRRIHLQDKPFETLVLLLERRGAVVTREELRARLWPADTFVAFDDSVNTAVRKLREALGDSADSPRFVETVPRHGYRFIGYIGREGPLTPDNRAPVAPPGNQEAGGEERAVLMAPGATMLGDLTGAMGGEVHRQVLVDDASGQRRAIPKRAGGSRFVSRMAVIVGLAIGLGCAWLLSRSATTSQATRADGGRLRRLTFESGYHASPSWTPDASMLVLTADRDDNVDVWLQHARGGPPLRLTDHEAADWQPAVSPEGSRIVFRSERAGGGLFVMPVLGGEPRRVTAFGHWPQWSPDGAQVLFFERQARTIETPPTLHVVGLSGEEPRLVAETLGAHAPAFCCFRGAAWHPDGHRISALLTDFGRRWVFVTYDIESGASVVSDTSRASAGGLESDREFGEERLFGSLAWAPRGDAVYFLAYSGGVRSIWRVRVDPETLHWIDSPERITTGPISIRDFSLSRSGDRIAFSTYEDAHRLWALPRNAANGQLTGQGAAIPTDGERAYAPDISPDGTRLAYVGGRSSLREIRVRALATGTEDVLFRGDGFQRSHPRWSMDGRALSYSRRQAQPAGVSSDAALFRWFEARGEEEALTSPGSPVGVAQAWARGSDLLLVVWFDTKVSPPRAAVALLDQSMAPTADRTIRVVATESDYDIYAQDLSPDGHWVAYNAVPRHPTSAASSRLFIAPVGQGRATPVSRGDEWEDKLRWTGDGRFVYFVSDSSGFFNIWARAFDAGTGTLLGDAFRVTQFLGPAHAMPSVATASTLNFAVSRDFIIAPVIDRTGSVWSLDVPD